ncbi:ABC transporter ATP-binding protein [soil metagenome]
MHPIIQVTNLEKQFKSRTNRNLLTGIWNPKWKYTTAVDGISFSINRGESVAFLGPNGAGKTTTTKMMTGLMYPTAGQIKVLGHIPFDRDHSFLRNIGLVMGNKAGLNWDLTANQSFWLLQNIYQIPKESFNKRLEHLSNLLSVDHKLDDQVRRLSLGERMKVELIGAILHEPEVLFLDEPTIGLDIESRNNVRNFLRTIQQENETTLVLTSHDMDDIEKVCDRVLVINNGRIAYDDSLPQLIKNYNKYKYIRLHFKNQVDPSLLVKYGEVIDDSNGILLKVPNSNLPQSLAKIPTRFAVDDINIESIPLESIIGDVFANSSAKSNPEKHEQSFG